MSELIEVQAYQRTVMVDIIRGYEETINECFFIYNGMSIVFNHASASIMGDKTFNTFFGEINNHLKYEYELPEDFNELDKELQKMIMDVHERSMKSKTYQFNHITIKHISKEDAEKIYTLAMYNKKIRELKEGLTMDIVKD